MNFNRVCILGMGYIGLPLASTFAIHNLKVVGMDINPKIIRTLQEGALHIHEPGLRALVQEALLSGNLSIQQQVADADAFIIAVPTPFDHDKRADLSFVISAAESICPHLRLGNLVILESTSPPRTTTQVVAPILERSGLKAGKDFFLAYSPERVLPGQILRELVEDARVIGGVDPESAKAGRDLYQLFVKGEIVLTDATTAETVKLMENTTRDVSIALANEFSRLADRLGVDVWEAISIANRHPRIKILRPGPGVGGHCVSVDPWFLVESAPDLTTLIRTARQVNDSQPHFVLDLARRWLGDLAGKRIGVLGLSFKPDVDDLRESPAIEIAHLLADEGALIQAYEPFKPGAVVPGLELVPSIEALLKEKDALLLLVAHTQFRELDPRWMAERTPARLVIDTVNVWDRPAWSDAGFNMHTLGVGR